MQADMVKMGVMFLPDLVEEGASPKEAFHAHSRAAKEGNIAARFAVAQCFLHGHGITPCSASYRDNLELAAKKGHVLAQYEMGLNFYHAQNGFPDSSAQACRWFIKVKGQHQHPEVTVLLEKLYREAFKLKVPDPLGAQDLQKLQRKLDEKEPKAKPVIHIYHRVNRDPKVTAAVKAKHEKLRKSLAELDSGESRERHQPERFKP